MVITLIGERPPLWNKIMRMSPHAQHREDDRVRRLVQTALRDKEWIPHFQGLVVIETIAYMKHPVADSDGVCDKFYIDALKRYRTRKIVGKPEVFEQEYWVISEDNPDYVPFSGRGVIKEKDNPRVEIHIKPYEQN